MSDPMLNCPKCGAEIKLTESLAAPLIESTRQQFQAQLAQKDAIMAQRDQAIRQREETLRQATETLDQRLADQLRVERTKIAAEEAKKARLAVSGDFDQKAKELAELHEVVKQNNLKLADAQKAQAQLLVKQRELDDAKREMELTIETRIQASLTTTRERAQKEAEERLNLKLAEKDQTLAAMQKQIEDLKRRAEQGSQQLQGEVLELQLESLLAAKFPLDRIEPVPKGEHGGDILHRIFSPAGALCGTILWESKRTKTWSDSWLPKLRDDQRAAKAELAVILSVALPKNVETFDHMDGIWIAHPRCLLPIALVLRQSLLNVAAARQSAQGIQSKAEHVYHYLTGPQFKHRVEAIIEAFTSMKDDLDKERKVITKQWAKREQEITRVLESTAGMYGDLQGIAGKSLAEIDGLDVKLLDSPAS